jgi:hypothetical protein
MFQFLRSDAAGNSLPTVFSVRQADGRDSLLQNSFKQKPDASCGDDAPGSLV